MKCIETLSGCNCPYCSGRRIIPGENDLKTKRPDLALEWNYERNKDITPSELAEQSNKTVWWKCAKGHEWKTSVANRIRGTNCPYCVGKKALAKDNDLATLRPDIALQWHPNKNGLLKPTEVTTGSGRKVWWKCAKGHEWEATISNICKGHGCPYCSRLKPIVGENDLATVMPALAAEWHPT